MEGPLGLEQRMRPTARRTLGPTMRRRLSAVTRVPSRRQLPTVTGHAVPTRECQSDRPSLSRVIRCSRPRGDPPNRAGYLDGEVHVSRSPAERTAGIARRTHTTDTTVVRTTPGSRLTGPIVAQNLRQRASRVRPLARTRKPVNAIRASSLRARAAPLGLQAPERVRRAGLWRPGSAGPRPSSQTRRVRGQRVVCGRRLRFPCEASSQKGYLPLRHRDRRQPPCPG